MSPGRARVTLVCAVMFVAATYAAIRIADVWWLLKAPARSFTEPGGGSVRLAADVEVVSGMSYDGSLMLGCVVVLILALVALIARARLRRIALIVAACAAAYGATGSVIAMRQSDTAVLTRSSGFKDVEGPTSAPWHAAAAAAVAFGAGLYGVVALSGEPGFSLPDAGPEPDEGSWE